MMGNAKTAVITGGTRGLGRDIVRLLVARGWNVVFDGRDRAKMQEAVRDLAVSASQIRAVPGDIADVSHRAALAKAAAQFGRIDAVINNASTLGASPLPRLLDFPL